MWQQKKCIKCGKYKAMGRMIKVTFASSTATYGYICKVCLNKMEKEG